MRHICGARGAFDPATLSLTGWWRTPYSASPWVGKASAGTSGSNNLTEATNPPGTSSLNGLSTAAFDGVNDQISHATLTTFFTTTGVTIMALLRVDVAQVNGTISDAALVTGSGSKIALGALGVASSPFAFQFGARTASGSSLCTTSSSYTLGTWYAVCCRYHSASSSLSLAVNSTFNAATVSGVTIAALSGTLSIGLGASSTWFNGQIAELLLSNTELSNDTFTKVRSYFANRYQVSV